jgi:hypothetical protein
LRASNDYWERKELNKTKMRLAEERTSYSQASGGIPDSARVESRSKRYYQRQVQSEQTSAKW